MSLLSPILNGGPNGHLSWYCPACRVPHAIRHGGDGWGWNGDAVLPTFTPSVKVIWPANLNAEERFKQWRTERICHSFVVAGQMVFLADCTHAMAGQTVDIPPWPPNYTPS